VTHVVKGHIITAHYLVVDPVCRRMSADLDRQVQQPLSLQAAGGATHGKPTHGRHPRDEHVHPGGREMHGGQ